jgi:5,5'-dehydrodivanillate O-demethylase
VLTREQSETLTRVGSGTPMGELLRRYWVPVAAGVEVAPGSAIPVRVFGEDLALFRTAVGAPGLVNARCPHRGASLAYGIADDDGIRCPYHGWRFDGDGHCLEITTLAGVDHEPLRNQAATTGYPVRELGGLVFAYLGPAPAPALPRYDLFAWSGVLRDIGRAIIPCNFLQIMENSVDPVHLEWLHGRNLTAQRMARGERAPTRYQRHHVDIGFDLFEHGIVKRRLLEGGSRDDDDWRVGHPLVFPLMVRVGAYRQHRFQIRVPVDDTHTLHWWYSCYLPAPGAPAVEQDGIPVYDVPFRDELGFLLDFVDGGDVMTWVTQGPIADRTREMLVDTDRGILLLRRLYLEQIERVAAGQDPLGVKRGIEIDEVIELAQEQHKYGDGAAFLAESLDASHVRYSPLRARIVELLSLTGN